MARMTAEEVGLCEQALMRVPRLSDYAREAMLVIMWRVA